jgi:hypothetical protein
MAKLKVTYTDGRVSEYQVTPAVEYEFETHFKKGFHKAIVEEGMQTYIYYLCWSCSRRAGEAPKPFGDSFMETLKSVEVLDDDPLA